MYRCGRYHSPTLTNSIIYWADDDGQVAGCYRFASGRLGLKYPNYCLGLFQAVCIAIPTVVLWSVGPDVLVRWC